MANSKNNIYPVDFTGELNLNNYKTDVSQYTGFQKKNSPIFGGTISPFWKKTEAVTDNNVIVDNNGNVWSIGTVNEDENGLYKKDLSGTTKLIHSFSKYGFTHKDLFSEDVNVIYALNEHSFVYIKNNNLYFVYKEHTVDYGRIIKTPQIALYELESQLVIFLSGESYLSIGQYIAGKIDSDGTYYFSIPEYGPSEDVKEISIHRISGTDYDKVLFCFSESSFAYEASINAGKALFPLEKVEEVTFSYSPYVDPIHPSQGEHPVGPCTVSCSNILFSSLGITFKEPVKVEQGPYGESMFILSASPKAYIGKGGIYDNQWGFSGVKTDTEEHLVGIPSDDIVLFKSNYVINKGVASSFVMLGTSGNGYKGILHSVNGRIQFVYEYDNTDDDLTINKGALFKLGNFSILINNNMISGIGYKGILLTEWNSVKSISPQNETDTIIYCDNQNKWHKITVEEKNEISLIDTHFILVNSVSNENFIDINTNKTYFFASDFNGRAYCGSGLYEYGDVAFAKLVPCNGTTWEEINSSLSEVYISGACYNGGFEITENPCLSIQLNPDITKCLIAPDKKITYKLTNSVYSFYLVYFSELENIIIDYYLSKGVETPVYSKSLFYIYTRQFQYINEELEDIEYPVASDGNIIYSPSLFSKFIESFINKNMIIINGNGYPLIYYNNKILFAYYFLSGIEKLTELFVIQGMSYGVADGKILAISYNSGTVSNTQCIVSVENMKFCGATSTEAYFWADTNKTLYTFKGDNSLSPTFTADSVGEVFFSSFNPTSNSVYIATDIGVFIIGSNGLYKVVDDVVLEIFRWKKGLVFKYPDKIVLYSFIKLNDFEIVPIYLETKFYGLGNNAVSVNDCVYLRFFDKDMKSGQIKISSKTLNNETISTEEKTIFVKPSDWDKTTQTLYVRYQPKNQRCIGFSVAIESPFAIGSMNIGSNPDTILISKTNS